MKFSRDALKIAFKNKCKRWIPVVEKDKDDPMVAMNKFNSNAYIDVLSTPKFTISKGSAIYTVGSCFARNVEVALNQQGMNVLGYDFSIDEQYIVSNLGVMNNRASGRAILNKYSTHGIAAEFDRVINKREIVDHGFVEISEGKWVDPLLSGSVIKPLLFDELCTIRASVDDLVASSVDADVVFITLGLNEVWFDHHTQSYMNAAPPPVMMRNDSDRFEFRTPCYAEVLEKIRKTVLLIRSVSSKDVKFIVTVSPVPLSTTWTASDVIAANTHSKSALRVAAAELTNEFDFVDYFPSYEMVTNSPRQLAWKQDQLHVDKKMVEFVISKFVDRYLETDA